MAMSLESLPMSLRDLSVYFSGSERCFFSSLAAAFAARLASLAATFNAFFSAFRAFFSALRADLAAFFSALRRAFSSFSSFFAALFSAFLSGSGSCGASITGTGFGAALERALAALFDRVARFDFDAVPADEARLGADPLD